MASRRLVALVRHFRCRPVAPAFPCGALSVLPCSTEGEKPARWCFTAAAAAAALAATATASTSVSCDTPAEKTGSVKLKDGRTIFYRSVGEGVPVIALHGMGSSSLTWKQERAEPGIRLIAVDRPGYGQSPAPPACYSYTQFVSDIAELADGLGLDRFCVAGHSSGGPYAGSGSSSTAAQKGGCLRCGVL